MIEEFFDDLNLNMGQKKIDKDSETKIMVRME
jgi:hypothetical protein